MQFPGEAGTGDRISAHQLDSGILGTCSEGRRPHLTQCRHPRIERPYRHVCRGYVAIRSRSLVRKAAGFG
jgi:hypothetical protein